MLDQSCTIRTKIVAIDLHTSGIVRNLAMQLYAYLVQACTNQRPVHYGKKLPPIFICFQIPMMINCELTWPVWP